MVTYRYRSPEIRALQVLPEIDDDTITAFVAAVGSTVEITHTDTARGVAVTDADGSLEVVEPGWWLVSEEPGVTFAMSPDDFALAYELEASA